MFKLKPTKIFVATIFSLALLLPIATQAFHALDGHQHEVCIDFSSHLHKKQLDCSICDFHFSTFDFQIQNYPEFIVFNTFHKVDRITLLTDTTSFLSHFFLRGPPLLS